MSFFSKSVSALALLGCLIVTSNLQASEIRGVGGLSLDFGGKTLISVVMSDGSTQSIKSHEGFGFMGGVYAPFNDGFGVTATVGYKVASIAASNGTMELTRIPLEVLGSKQVGPHRFGAGITHQTNINFSCDVSGICNGDTDLDDASGFLLSYEFLMNNNSSDLGKGMLFGARYTMLDLKAADNSTVDASGFGLYIGGQF